MAIAVAVAARSSLVSLCVPTSAVSLVSPLPSTAEIMWQCRHGALSSVAYFPCTYLCYLLSTAPVAISASIPCRCLNQPVHRFLFGIKTVFLRFMAHPYMPLPSDNTGILSCTCLSTAPHSLLPSQICRTRDPPRRCLRY